MRIFAKELRRPEPRLKDEWFPYVVAFGLTSDADRWFRAHGAAAGGGLGLLVRLDLELLLVVVVVGRWLLERRGRSFRRRRRVGNLGRGGGGDGSRSLRALFVERRRRRGRGWRRGKLGRRRRGRLVRHPIESPPWRNRSRSSGAGLAGSECAWQLALRGHRVRLYEMRPKVGTSAHQTDRCAELVCSNSFRSDNPRTPSGCSSARWRLWTRWSIRSARAAAVPAGDAFAIDRGVFATLVTEAIASRPEITLVREEIREIPREGLVVIATGPLTSTRSFTRSTDFLGTDDLYFYDAIAPIVDADSLDLSKLYWKSRYGKGDGRTISTAR